jgi:uncharacterized protein YkwD
MARPIKVIAALAAFAAFASVAALAAFAAGVSAVPGPASAPNRAVTLDASRMAVAFEWALDVERGGRGLPALRVDPVESREARTWATTMALTRRLADDPGIKVAIAAHDPGWRLLGENVGSGATPESLEAAFVASPANRANILGAYTHVGVGVAIRSGRIWVTERFYR